MIFIVKTFKTLQYPFFGMFLVFVAVQWFLPLAEVPGNPCDIMTAIATKLAGPDFPQGKIFGAGTCLDTSRFQSLIAHAMDLDPRNVHGYIIGEHGDSSIPVWSSVRVGALPLLDPGQEPDETLQKIHKKVIDSAYEVGYGWVCGGLWWEILQ